MKFEGPEKKLEIILTSPQPDLRSNVNRRWDRVVEASGSVVISKISTPFLDARLLSESSLFVWDDCILMITCGQTTLVNTLDEITTFVDKDNVAFVFYERKNLMFPQDQPSDFEDDVSAVTSVFPGKSYRLGPANYDHLHVFYSARDNAEPDEDTTLQILMNDLGPEARRVFSDTRAHKPDTAGKKAGLFDLYPQPLSLDDYQFTPYGYSLNGIIDKRYFTVHVTPQPAGSYASFETNIIEKDYSRIVNAVISIFRPGKFCLALTTSIQKQVYSLSSDVIAPMPGYKVIEKSLYEFDCGYSVIFFNYARR